MPKSTIIYQSNEEIIGKHIRSKEWVMYSGKLTIFDRKTNPIVLKLKSEIDDTFIGEFMEEKKEFKGNSLSNVYGKVAKWYLKNGVIFQN
ncbi:hypothetical protein E9993_15940 [Labilibacter sediminis]|nr:hypothetical protein E9993_15940 [Labilibacter sediminis]